MAFHVTSTSVLNCTANCTGMAVSCLSHMGPNSPQDPIQLKKERFEMMCVLLAIGLNPTHCCLFNQDQVPAHSEMAWILNCIAPVGRLNRLTTWKSQSRHQKTQIHYQR
ncbi:hypothetical protein H4Q26_007372 [Puccinia striiformis f. sp. tritici PST-130]|nr:hypothetical protein H4Q26_007372 [Puccinia striiformis f. sp. tritici PST-130]